MSSFEVVSGVPVVVAPEEIDITNAEALRSAMVQAAAYGTFVVDMTATRFCDSAGIHTLLAAHKRAQSEGSELLLVIPDFAALRVFQITGLDRVLSSAPSLDQALARTSAVGPGIRQAKRQRVLPQPREQARRAACDTRVPAAPRALGRGTAK